MVKSFIRTWLCRAKFRVFPYFVILPTSFYYFSVNLYSQEKKITNEKIYCELKIFEAKTEERFKPIDDKFRAIDQRFEMMEKSIYAWIDNLYTFLWMLLGIFTTMVLTFASLLFWDRKTTVEVSVKKSFDKVESKGTSKKLLDALRELAKEDKKIA